jgi:hypothetical protein
MELATGIGPVTCRLQGNRLGLPLITINHQKPFCAKGF